MRIPAHSSDENKIVSRITDLILTQGKQQKELMSYLGLSKSLYNNWKKGISNTYMLYIDEIAYFLNVSPSFLIRGDSSENTDFENKFLATLRELTKEQQEKLLVFAQSMCGKPIK